MPAYIGTRGSGWFKEWIFEAVRTADQSAPKRGFFKLMNDSLSAAYGLTALRISRRARTRQQQRTTATDKGAARELIENFRAS